MSLLNLELNERCSSPDSTMQRAEGKGPWSTVFVIITARDAGQNLRMTNNSVLAQRGVTFRLIVVDDGSRDSTALAARALLADVWGHMFLVGAAIRNCGSLQFRAAVAKANFLAGAVYASRAFVLCQRA